MVLSDAHNAYLESRVLTADPVELVRILYRATLDSIREAKAHLANGDIERRSRALTKAVCALAELDSSLDHDAGGKLSHMLAELYDYMQRRLLQANFEQAEEPMNEVAGLLATLLEGWQSVETPKSAASEGVPGDSMRFSLEDSRGSLVSACA
jgi:flagellar secretion chaperone FliS